MENIIELRKRLDELKLLIKSYTNELKSIEKQIWHLTFDQSTHYEEIYDDEQPDYIKGNEDGI